MTAKVTMNLLVNLWARPWRMVALGLLLALILGGSFPRLAGAITWGEEDTNNIHPNVGVFLVSLPDGRLIPFCTGTLIQARVFLTAAHCTAYVEGLLAQGAVNDVVVSFDQDPLAAGAQRLAVEKIVTHPKYKNFIPYANPHDVGALILQEAVNDITPATLPAAGFLDQLRAEGKLRQGRDGAKFRVVGYGDRLAWPPPAFIPNAKRYFADSEYQTLLKAWLRLSQNRSTGDGGTCFGDSGGPGFWRTEDGTEVLVGITSWGDSQCVATGFDYRVDIPETLSFIESVIPK